MHRQPHALLLLACLGLCSPSIYADSVSETPAQVSSEARSDKILVTFNALPAAGNFEVLGPIYVFKRWFGGTGAAMSLLGEKARSMGANAVVESSVWLAPAFPAQVAPHGKGIAVRVNDPKLLQALADESSTWE